MYLEVKHKSYKFWIAKSFANKLEKLSRLEQSCDSDSSETNSWLTRRHQDHQHHKHRDSVHILCFHFPLSLGPGTGAPGPWITRSGVLSVISWTEIIHRPYHGNPLEVSTNISVMNDPLPDAKKRKCLVDVFTATASRKHHQQTFPVDVKMSSELTKIEI